MTMLHIYSLCLLVLNWEQTQYHNILDFKRESVGRGCKVSNFTEKIIVCMCVRAAVVQLRASRLCQNKRKKQLNQDDYYELSMKC